MCLIYSSIRVLSSLENIVHRSGERLNRNFKCIVISIPNSVRITEIKLKDLPDKWFEYKNYKYCQAIGDKWIYNKKTALLKVPSAIIKKEYNFLINPDHQSFKKIQIRTIENFEFDPRLGGK